MNIEQKLDTLLYSVDVLLTGQQALVSRVDLIEKKLAKTEVNISSPISVTGGNNNDPEVINKHLYDLVNKVQRRTSEPKIKIACKDEKGEIFTLDGIVKEDGSIVCEPMTESRTIVGWSLKKEEVPLYKDKRFITQEHNEAEKLKRFGRVNRDGTIEWDEWKPVK